MNDEELNNLIYALEQNQSYAVLLKTFDLSHIIKFSIELKNAGLLNTDNELLEAAQILKQQRIDKINFRALAESNMKK